MVRQISVGPEFSYCASLFGNLFCMQKWHESYLLICLGEEFAIAGFTQLCNWIFPIRETLLGLIYRKESETVWTVITVQSSPAVLRMTTEARIFPCSTTAPKVKSPHLPVKHDSRVLLDFSELADNDNTHKTYSLITAHPVIWFACGFINIKI